MESTENLKELFESKLRVELGNLESKRKNIFNRNLVSILVLIVGGITIIQGKEITTIFGLLFIGLAIVSFYFAYKNYKLYKIDYKNNVVKRIIEIINPDWHYDYESAIDAYDYQESELFTKKWDRYNGDDLIHGTIGKTEFHLSELHTEYKSSSRDSKGNRKESWHTIFKGLFVMAEFHKHIQGKTIVVPDYTEKILGKWVQKFQKFSSRGDLVKLENVEFEQLFAVYSSNQIEARYILTPAMMEAIVKIRKQYQRPMHISFKGSKVFIAMSYNKDLFEPRIIRSGVRFSDVEEMYAQINLISFIIKEMNLNSRIWSKE